MSSTSTTSINVTVEAKKRLLRDLKEIHQHPLENVTAAPVDDENMFIWHANLRGVDSEMKEVFHFILEFPTTYPLNPPSVTLCTPLPHPNVFPAKNGKKGFTLCMDMLEQGAWSEDIDKNVQFSGWSSSYSVQLVLVQLQSFLLDAQLQYSTQKGTLADSLDKAKKFACSSCSHKPNSPFPAFATPQQLASRTTVKVCKFVSKPRASHILAPQIRRITTAPSAPATPAVAASPATPAPATFATTPKGVPPPTQAAPTPDAPTTSQTPASSTPKSERPISPAKPEWVVVKSRRTDKTSDKPKKEAKAATGKQSPPPKKSTKQPTQPKAKKVAASPSLSPSSSFSYKKSKEITTEVDFDAVMAEKPIINFSSTNSAAHQKDYVKLMLQDAAARELMLQQRAQEDKEELKREKRRLRKKAKKLEQVNAALKPVKKEEPVVEVVVPKTAKTVKKATKKKAEVVVVEQPKVEEKAKVVPPAVTSWADEDEDLDWEPVAPVKQSPAPAPAPAPIKKQQPQPSNDLTFQQLQAKVRIDHHKLGSLKELPLDILLNTFSFLPTAQIANLSAVSVDMHKVTEDGVLWRELFSRHYPKSKLTASNIADWKFVFMREVDHIMDELVCFHTKVSFDEDVLGIPINFSVNPKTERVDYISSTLDILSSTAFNKHGIRKSPYKEPFTHFLPLYINEDHFERALPEIKKLCVALSPEYRTKDFSPKMVLSVFPKLMNTMIVLVMDGGVTASVKALNGYYAFHRLLLAFVEMYPALMIQINDSIGNFLKSEDNRVKSEVPSLGDFIPLISVSNKYTWTHAAKAVVGETFDRNVIWICKQDPSLSTLGDIAKLNANNNAAKPGVEQNRLDKSFEASLVSQKLLLFHVYFLTRVARPSGLTLAQVADNYDRYLGRPNSKVTDSFHNAVKKIKGLRGWPDFFFLAGIPCPTPAGLTTMLRDNVRNSKKKGYHNDHTNFRNIQASGTSVILKKGDSYSAAGSLEKVVMGLGWGCEGHIKFLDATCFEYTSAGEYLEAIDFSHTTNTNGSITHSGDVCDYEKLSVEHTIRISLSKLRPETTTLVFTITAYSDTLKHAKLPWVRLSDGATNQELCRYVLENTGDHTAVVMCVMKKNALKKCWDLKVIAKLDEGRATSYNPLKQNIGILLKGLPQ